MSPDLFLASLHILLSIISSLMLAAPRYFIQEERFIYALFDGHCNNVKKGTSHSGTSHPSLDICYWILHLSPSDAVKNLIQLAQFLTSARFNVVTGKKGTGPSAELVFYYKTESDVVYKYPSIGGTIALYFTVLWHREMWYSFEGF